MELLVKIDFDECAVILDWLNTLSFGKKVKSSYAPERLEQWFRAGSNMQSITDGRGKIEYHDEAPDFVSKIGDTYMKEGWDSILVCKGEKPFSDTSIDWHRDHGHFEGPAIMFNWGESIYMEQDYDQGTLTGAIGYGDVVRINTKLVHKSTQLSDLRYNITFRKIKQQYINKVKTLF